MTVDRGAVCRVSSSWHAAAALIATLFAGPLANGVALAQTITISANPAAMNITTAAAGSAPTAVTNNVTRYTIVTQGSTKKITAQLTSSMPTGVTLQINLQAPSGATSAGTVTLSTTAKNVVTNIPVNTNRSNLTITYTLSSTLAAGVVSSRTRTVTFTVATPP